MSIKLSARVQAVRPSPTLAITARAKALRASGKDVIGLGAGEPDFDTPDHIKEAAIAAINDGFTKYTAVDGTPELKQAIIAKFQRDNGFEYGPDQILVSCGGKQSFYNLAQAILDPGDEVIIPAPYWVSYPDMALLAGGAPVLIHAGADQEFKITPAQLKASMTEQTKLVVINSPSNPTGMAYSREELAALGEVLREFPRAVIATDDMYEHIRWSSDPFVNILHAMPGSDTAHPGAQRRLQGLLHDRLAHRLRRRSREHHQGHEEGAVPEHLQPHVHLPGSGPSRPGGPAGLHPEHARGLQGASRLRGRPSQPHARYRMPANRRHLLRLSQRGEGMMPAWAP